MTALGSNAHILSQPQRREQLRWCFATVAGCPVAEVDRLGMPEPLLVVRFPGGGNIELTTDPDADQPGWAPGLSYGLGTRPP